MTFSEYFLEQLEIFITESNLSKPFSDEDKILSYISRLRKYKKHDDEDIDIYLWRTDYQYIDIENVDVETRDEVTRDEETHNEENYNDEIDIEDTRNDESDLESNDEDKNLNTIKRFFELDSEGSEYDYEDIEIMKKRKDF
jgi:hypothetical protein